MKVGGKQAETANLFSYVPAKLTVMTKCTWQQSQTRYCTCQCSHTHNRYVLFNIQTQQQQCTCQCSYTHDRYVLFNIQSQTKQCTCQCNHTHDRYVLINILSQTQQCTCQHNAVIHMTGMYSSIYCHKHDIVPVKSQPQKCTCQCRVMLTKHILLALTVLIGAL